MSKVVAMFIALVAFCALPAVAFAGGDNVSSGNTQNGTHLAGRERRRQQCQRW